MKKTLLVTLDFYPNVGGIAGYWEKLSACMNPLQWIVCAPMLPSQTREHSTPYRIYRGPFLSTYTYPRWLPLFLLLLNIIQKEQITHLIVGQVLPVGTVVLLLTRFVRIPYTVSCHGMDILLPLLHTRKKFLVRSILKKAHSIIVNSEFTGTRLLDYGIDRNRVHIVYPCPVIVPTDNSVPQDVSHDEPLILSVARLTNRKGHEYILAALPELIPLFPRLIYVIVGDGPNRAQLEEYVRIHGLSDHVRFVGTPDRAQTGKWFAQCTLFAMTPHDLPGDQESFGIVYLEANAFGKPVIGTRCGGIPEAVIDGVTGLLVEQEQSGAIRQAIQYLLRNPAYAVSLGTQGRARVVREFQWHIQAQKLIDLLA